MNAASKPRRNAGEIEFDHRNEWLQEGPALTSSASEGVVVANCPYRDFGDAELLELKRELEKFQRKKIREKHNAPSDEDSASAGQHAVQLGHTLHEMELEFAARREGRRLRRERGQHHPPSPPQQAPVASPPPGWYTTENSTVLRWWDGQQWGRPPAGT